MLSMQSEESGLDHLDSSIFGSADSRNRARKSIEEPLTVLVKLKRED